MDKDGEKRQSICRDIFKAVHEGKWLCIEYKNKKDILKQYFAGE